MKPRASFFCALTAVAVLVGACTSGTHHGTTSGGQPPASVTTTTTTPGPAPSTSAPPTTLLLASAVKPPQRRSNGALPASEGFVRSEPWLQLHIETRTTRVASGATVSGTFVATNLTDGIWDITHPGSAPIHFGLFFDGKRVGVGYAEAAAIYPDRLQPHETRRWEFSTPATHQHGEPLEPGVYDLYVALSTVSAQWAASPVSITVS